MHPGAGGTASSGHIGLASRLAIVAHGRAAALLVAFGGGAILACDLVDPTLDPRQFAASEHAIGKASWLFHLGVGAIFVAALLLLVRLRGPAATRDGTWRGTRRALATGLVGIVGLVVFPTDPGWEVVSVAGRLHPTFALVAAGSLLIAGSRLAHRRRLLVDTGAFIAAGFAGGMVGGGPGAAERAALAVVGVLLYLGARRTNV
jgi:hypothetical protein